MSCCGHCQDADSLFSERTARRDLRRYRRRGPLASTRRLLRQIEAEPIEGAVLLDVGGGVGALQHELLRSGLGRAVQVDASAAYLRASETEADRQGHRDRTEYRHGDFAEAADDLPDADLVTLDRVVCCYPDMPRLIAAAAGRARRLCGLTYPRERRSMRVALGLGNLWHRLTRSRFRTYLYPPAEIRAELERCGFRRIAHDRTFLWEVELYRREGVAG